MDVCRKASETLNRSITAEADTSTKKQSAKVKKEPATTTTATSTVPHIHSQGLSPSDDLRDEPGDFIETNCHWKDCGLELPTQVNLISILAFNF